MKFILPTAALDDILSTGNDLDRPKYKWSFLIWFLTYYELLNWFHYLYYLLEWSKYLQMWSVGQDSGTVQQSSGLCTYSPDNTTMPFYLEKANSVINKVFFNRAKNLNNQVAVHPHDGIRHGAIRQWIKSKIHPFYFKYYRAPTERNSQAHYVMYARHRGNVVVLSCWWSVSAFHSDDNLIESTELYNRAYQITPFKMKQER